MSRSNMSLNLKGEKLYLSNASILLSFKNSEEN